MFCMYNNMYVCILYVNVFQRKASKTSILLLGLHNHNEGYDKFKAGRKIRNLSYQHSFNTNESKTPMQNLNEFHD